MPVNKTTSRDGILFIARREALVLTAYQDGPHMSIGFGHNDPNLKPGDKITVKQAFDYLKQDIKDREKNICKLLKQNIEQNKFDAIMSLHYQSGNRYAPAVIALINAKEFKVAAELFPLCDRNIAGEEIEGLRGRRILEQNMFLTGSYGELSPIPYWTGDPRKTKRKEYVLKEGDL